MKNKLHAELWDKMHYMFRNYNDRMVHLKIKYDKPIDLDTLKTVIICFFEKAPVLHSSFRASKINPYWEINKYSIDDILSVYDGDDADQKSDEFLTQYIPYDAKVQMKIGVFRNMDENTLCIIENHMCMDGGDMKYFIKELCRNYTNYKLSGISPVELKVGSRSYDLVYKDFNETEQALAKKLYKNLSATTDQHKFPLEKDSIKDRSFIVKKKISAELFNEVYTVGKKQNATINDILTAVFFFSLYEIAGFNKNESCGISCAIDLRRHMESTDNTGLTNQTAWMQCVIPNRGDNIFQTIEYVKNEIEKFKSDKFMGLYGIPLLKIAYTIMPYQISENVIKAGYSNPYIAMSNIGVLNPDELALCENKPIDAFMTGAVKYKPFVLLSVTSFNKELTLSMCIRGSEKDEETVKRFFEIYENNLKKIAE